MNPASIRAAKELLAEANRLLEGNESLADQDTIRAPAIFIDGVKDLLESLIQAAVVNGNLEQEPTSLI
ncbi:hypothetical protein CFBP498_19510 [Xanthomonas hortorum pv. vitians]|uniref:Uncharacterized protein n=1 Tax=Xanthomonas hortorum pv. vitians TaxID=83224 RepID=A0A6V7D2V8_9XANT|nr:hypothetical protein [Xanthomonas hortorum]MDT7824246.1 hypothetical protein [Xanthomonas hortorum pv. vitians]MDV7246928.1 hypothetical protein [Xanthomonas hortorum pv. vitians]NMI30512.1 hypothetical protein [Xanthomonas hortorum pv. vitians]CAD0326946.1 hypothetical protein CFBP498_19510 [Xanthomonas hortorum pv. vitians]CAD0326955.1 hypothetical protein CFBP498_19510 [Xanthomonas hortorum pv. vitians]